MMTQNKKERIVVVVALAAIFVICAVRAYSVDMKKYKAKGQLFTHPGSMSTERLQNDFNFTNQ